jgi:hypothetical protein
LRGSVVSHLPVQISSNFGDYPDEKAKFNFQAATRNWDAERKVLTLGGCEVLTERPRYNTVLKPQNVRGSRAADGAPQGPPETLQVLAGFDKEGFGTDLSLSMGQETVVGSLGGNALLVVLRFTVDPGVN